jgi:hypothetical protein
MCYHGADAPVKAGLGAGQLRESRSRIGTSTNRHEDKTRCDMGRLRRAGDSKRGIANEFLRGLFAKPSPTRNAVNE